MAYLIAARIRRSLPSSETGLMPIALVSGKRILVPQIGAFFRVTLRLATPGMVTAALLAFIFSWNNFMFSLILAGSKTQTLPVAIFNFVSYAYVDWGGLMAAAVMITLPIMILSMCLQKYIVSGLTAGAVKG